MSSKTLSPGVHFEQADPLYTVHEDVTSHVFTNEQESAEDTQQGNSARFKNAYNPYASALADVFGLEA